MGLTPKSFCILLALLASHSIGLPQEAARDGTIRGVVVDILDARITNATLTFWDGPHEFHTQTQPDGTYSIRLNPGTYTMSVASLGFCTVRRAPFHLEQSASVQFNFQMWVCPSDTVFIQYAELEEVRQTHLKPLVLFGERDFLGEQDLQSAPQRFRGPRAFDDGTRHPRNYPAVFTFNLLTVQAEQLTYDPLTQLLKAVGNVTWEDGANSHSANAVEIRLDGFKPKPKEIIQ